MADIDTNQFILKPQQKEVKPRVLAQVVITEAQRQQYFSGSKGDDKNTVLARKAKQAIKDIEANVAIKKAEEEKVQTEKADKAMTDVASGNLDFGALISSGSNLKDF